MEKTKLKCCYGISSKVKNDQFNRHIFMIDYDHVDIISVKKHLKHLIDVYKLSDIYLIESTHGYNALSLDLLPIGLIFDMGINVFSPADRDFFKYGFNRQYYVLRFDIDKKLVEIVKSKYNLHDKSLAHKKFIEWFFNIKISNSDKFNNNTKLDVIQYPSNKNGYHLQDKLLPENYIETLARLRQ